MRTVPVVLVTVWLVAQSSPAPTMIDRAFGDLQGQVLPILDDFCSTKGCLFGERKFDLSSFSCSCPEWPDPLVSLTSLAILIDIDKEFLSFTMCAKACYAKAIQ